MRENDRSVQIDRSKFHIIIRVIGLGAVVGLAELVHITAVIKPESPFLFEEPRRLMIRVRRKELHPFRPGRPIVRGTPQYDRGRLFIQGLLLVDAVHDPVLDTQVDVLEIRLPGLHRGYMLNRLEVRCKVQVDLVIPVLLAWIVPVDSPRDVRQRKVPAAVNRPESRVDGKTVAVGKDLPVLKNIHLPVRPDQMNTPVPVSRQNYARRIIACDP